MNIYEDIYVKTNSDNISCKDLKNSLLRYSRKNYMNITDDIPDKSLYERILHSTKKFLNISSDIPENKSNHNCLLHFKDFTTALMTIDKINKNFNKEKKQIIMYSDDNQELLF